MTNPIETQMRVLFPDYELTEEDRKEIEQAGNDAAPIAASLPDRVAALRRICDGHFGAGVVTDHDIARILALGHFRVLGQLSRDYIYRHLGFQRTFELGQRSVAMAAANDARSEQEEAAAALYTLILGRAPRPTGLRNMLRQIDAGTPISTLASRMEANAARGAK